MGQYLAEDKFGRYYDIDIKGDTPSTTELARIQSYLDGVQPPEEPQPSTTEEPGLGGNVANRLAVGWNKAQAGADIIAAGAFKAAGMPKSAKRWQKAAEAQLEEAATYPVRERPFYEEETIGGSIANLAGVAAEMAPATLGTIGAALVGGPAVGAAAGLAMALPQSVAANAERQIQETGDIKDWQRLAVASGLSATVETGSNLLFGGLGGLFTKPASLAVKREILRRAVDRGVKGAVIHATKRVGAGAAVGYVTEATEEVLQQGLERWQADLALLDDEAKEEYIVSALTGGILGSVFGGAAGAVRSRAELKPEQRRKEFEQGERDAREDADAEYAARQQPTSIPDSAALPATEPPPVEEEAPEPLIAVMPEDDRSLPVALRESAEPPKQVTAPVAEPTPVAAETTPVTPEAFSEDDYRKSVDALRPQGRLSPSKVAKVLGIKTDRARLLLDQMQTRGDTKPSGTGKYPKVVSPETKVEEKAEASRDFEVRRVPKANSKPFKVEVNGKKQGVESFASEADARAWASRNIPRQKQKDVVVAEDPDAFEHAIYERTFDAPKKGKPKKQSGEKLVSVHDTEKVAKAALKKLNPQFSMETNLRAEPTPEERTVSAKQDVEQTLSPYIDLQAHADTVAGGGRARVEVVPTIDDQYMRSQGYETDLGNAVAEGVTFRNRDRSNPIRQVVALARRDPNLSQEEQHRQAKSVLNHELIHVLKRYNLLTPQEWQYLYEAARTTKVPGKTYTWLQRAKALNPSIMDQPNWTESLFEEAVAEMFRHYTDNPKAFTGQTRALLARIAEFLRKLIGLGRRHDVTDVMDMINRGEVASRPDQYGGMQARNADDVSYSLIKPDNFYLRSERAVQAFNQKEGEPPPTAKRWIDWLYKHGLNKEGKGANELEWLGLVPWLESHGKDTPVDKRDVLSFIRANSPDIKIELQGHPKFDFETGMNVQIGWPKYPDMQTPGGSEYTEALITFTPRAGQPTFITSHWDRDNVLAHIRFKTITDADGKRRLFIEEIQSDLHQEAARAGGYYSAASVAKVDDFRRAFEDASRQYKDLRFQLNNVLKRLESTKEERLNIVHLMNSFEGTKAREGGSTVYLDEYIAEAREDLSRVDNELFDLRAAVDDLTPKVNQAQEESGERFKVFTRASNALRIPNAPFKTGWETYVVKRLMRHALEHGFDGIAWHGQPESVAEVEGWPQLVESETEKGKAYHIEGTEKNVTSIINRYMKLLPRIGREIAQPFGGTVDEVTPTAAASRPRVNLPDLDSEEGIRAAFPTKDSLKDILAKMKRRRRSDVDDMEGVNDARLEEEIEKRDRLVGDFEFAMQIASNQREFDVIKAFDRAGLAVESLTDDGYYDSHRLEQALRWTQPGATWVDTMLFAGQNTLKQFRLDFTERMRETFERGDVPIFSKIEARGKEIQADTRFRDWFGAGVVTNPDGTPHIVYHSTRADEKFSIFNRLSHFGTADSANARSENTKPPFASAYTIGDWLGFHSNDIPAWWNALTLSEIDDLTREYYESLQIQNTRIYPVYLNLRRPLDIVDDKSNHNSFAYGLAMRTEGVLSEERFREIMDLRVDDQNNYTPEGEQAALTEIVLELERAGYDGFRYINQAEDVGSTSYVAIRPEQIKSIYNPGGWDPNNPDIMYSRLEARGRDLSKNDEKFKRWFMGSKAVDRNGNPILLFHGRIEDFDTFDFTMLGQSTLHPTAALGTFLSADPQIASAFAGEDFKARRPTYTRGANVIPAFLSVKNPFVMPVERFTNLVAWAQQKIDRGDRIGAYRAILQAVKDMKDAGHDGMRIVGDPAMSSYLGGFEYTADTWVVFQPSQIKSALNKEFSDSDSFKFSMIEAPSIRETMSSQPSHQEPEVPTDQPQYAMTAPIGQRVPPAPPIDRLDEVIRGATYNNLAPVMQRFIGIVGGKIPFVGGKIKKAAPDVAEAGIIQLQDRMQPAARLIDTLRKNGGVVTTENDAYLQQAMMSGRVRDQLDENQRLLYDPLARAIKNLNVTQRDADDLKNLTMASKSIMGNYENFRHGMSEVAIYAQHAKERNAEMAKRNAKFRQGTLQQTEGSGMTDVEADMILNWFRSKTFGGKFLDVRDPTSIRSLYRKIIANTNYIRVATGLTPDFRNMRYQNGDPVDPYEDYAPLRGFLSDHVNSIHDDDVFAHTGLGFNIRGKEDPSAAGRAASMGPHGRIMLSLGADLMANAILQNQEAIVRGAKNMVDQSLYKLYIDNQQAMDQFAEEIHAPQSKWAYNAKTGSVQLQADPLALNDPNVLKFKVKGQQKYLRFYDQRMAKAFGASPSLGGDGLGNLVLRAMRKYNRVMANLITSFSPEYGIPNAVRDLETAIVNMSEYPDGKNMRLDVLKNVGPAGKGIWNAIRKGDRTSYWAKVFLDFKEQGGMTSLRGIASLEDAITGLNKVLQEDMSGAPKKSIRAVRAIGNFIESWNLSMENATRIAVYDKLLKHFLSLTNNPNDPVNIRRAKQQAAFAAKRKTIDFDMGGEARPWLNAFWLFFNASFQGALAMVNPLIRSKRMRKVWLGIMGIGMLQDFLNSLISPDDEDGKKRYDKLNDYILEHNMVFIDPFGLTERGYVKIPMPYGLNAIHNFGRVTAKALRGGTTPGKAMSSAIGTTFAAFNPLGEANTFLNYVAPTVLDPVVDLYMNENYAGVPIAPEASPYGPSEVASQRYWNNTAPLAISVADWMSYLTGRKSDYVPGEFGIEISPNQLGFVLEQMTGGLGATVARTYNFLMPEAALGKGVLEKMVFGDETDEVEINDIPFLRRFLGSVTSKNDLENFIAGRDKVLRIRMGLRDAARDGDRDAIRELRESFPDEIRISGRINAIENARKKISTLIKRTRDSDRLTNEQKEARVKLLKERQDKLIGIGNKVLESMDIQ